MTDDQAREMFSAALEETLAPADKAAFDEHLQAHPALAAEYARFQDMFSQAAQAHRAVSVPDLLPGVQKKLRDRSRRDGTAQLRGRGFLTPWTLGLVLVGLLAILWCTMYVMTQLSSP